MGDKELAKFVVENLQNLTACTVIGPEFVIHLRTNGLIDGTEQHYLLNGNTPNSVKAITLYTEIGRRWGNAQFEDFKRALQESKNVTALQIFHQYEIRSKPTTQLLHRNKEQAPDIEQQTNQGCYKLPKTNEAEIPVTVTNSESGMVKDVDRTVIGGTLVMEIVKKLDSSRITTSKAESNPKGRTKAVKVVTANLIECGQMNSGPSSSSSVLVNEQQMNVTELLTKTCIEDLNSFIYKKEVAWKLARTFSRDELFSLLTNEETRVCDKYGWPIHASVSLGEELVPQGVQMAVFRGKFGGNKGKTVFELTKHGLYFELKVLWSDLLAAMDEGNNEGPVTVALRDAIGRKEGDNAGWKLIRELENEVKRRSRNTCSRLEPNFFDSSSTTFKAPDVPKGVRVMNWSTDCMHQWINNSTYTPLEALPYIVRYSRSITPIQLRSFLQGKNLNEESDLLAALRSLIILSSASYQDGQPSCLFPAVAAFVEENIQSVPPHLMLMTQKLMSGGAEYKQFLPNNRSKDQHRRLVCNVSVGEALLRLVFHLKHWTGHK